MKRYEIELYANDLGEKTETHIVWASSVSMLDGQNGCVFVVAGPKSVPVLVVPLARLKSMKAITKAQVKKGEFHVVMARSKKTAGS